MRTKLMTALLGLSLCGVPAMIGCDRTVSHEKTVKETPGGSRKVEEKTVTEKPDGTIESKTEKKVDR